MSAAILAGLKRLAGRGKPQPPASGGQRAGLLESCYFNSRRVEITTSFAKRGFFAEGVEELPSEERGFFLAERRALLEAPDRIDSSANPPLKGWDCA